MAASNARMSVIDHLSVPETYGGYKLDSLLAYSTPRFVNIEDRRLGCLYYFLVLLVALWVVGFQILYGNNHCKLFDVLGESRMTIQQPTKKGCNPRKDDCEDNVTPRNKLPYCEAYTGADKMKHASNCTYADMVELVPNGPENNALFVPTRIDRTVQQRGCSAGPDGADKCKKMWKNKEVNKFTYVAGIEDYTVLIRSSYIRKGIVGHSFSHVGYYYQCKDPGGKVIKTNPCDAPNVLTQEEIKCIPGLKCNRDTSNPPEMNAVGLMQTRASDVSGKKLRAGHRNASVQSMLQANDAQEEGRSETDRGGPIDPDVYAIPGGDVFTVRKLLELAGMDLDKSLDEEDVPLRQRGSAITVNIEYNNMKKFHPATVEVGYTYRVIEQPLDEVKAELYSMQQPQEANTRIMENRHGIIVNGKVTGTFGFNSVVYVLVMLTTSLALLGVARTVVDFVAVSLPNKKQAQYKQAKFLTFHPTESGNAGIPEH